MIKVGRSSIKFENVYLKSWGTASGPKEKEGPLGEYIDISLEDCIRLALGNNPRIQAAMQDVFASDARIRQAWSAYFPQLSWQTGYTKIKQLQLSDALGRDLIFNYFVFTFIFQ